MTDDDFLADNEARLEGDLVPVALGAPAQKALVDQTFDRNMGDQVCVSIDAFTYFEIGAFDKSSSQGFVRNKIAAGPAEINRWRMRYDNTGVFRTVLSSNNPNFIREFSDPETLQYGDLCFDMDAPKDMEGDLWTQLILEIEEKLVPRLMADFGLRTSDIRFWFSGGRGIHVEVPAEILGVWPHHDLHRIFNFYAREVATDLDMKFLDLSLYGAKHLYRLEHSRHQRTGLYKWPLKFTELAAVRDDFEFLRGFASAPRLVDLDQLYTTPTLAEASKALNFYATLVGRALEIRRVAPPTNTGPRDKSTYSQSRYVCVDTLMSPGYVLERGSRHAMILYLASHYRDAGFSYDEALAKLMTFATEHCDPPLASDGELHDLERYLTSTYENGRSAGCTYIQNNFPTLCKESACPVGQSRIRARQRQVR